MKICFVAEGCYPYVVGGVSSWVNSMIKAFPEHKFIVVAIVADRSTRGKFKYVLPENVTDVYEVYLKDYDWSDEKSTRKPHFSKEEKKAFLSLIANDSPDWNAVFDIFEDEGLSIDDLLMGEDFLNSVVQYYKKDHSDAVFSDFLWTMRSMYLPLFHILKFKVPKADLYHCVATGYAGVIGAMAKKKYNCGLIISEHGIYTREREEELIKAEWASGVYKDIWIDQFKKMGRIAYDRADLVTSLYEHARELQIELGCPPSKQMVTPNGINLEAMENAPGKKPEDEDYINIGAVLRVTAIKDIKTMIRAFAYAREKNPKLKLWIMGPEDEEPDYARECHELVESLNLNDVIFTGRINTVDYIGRMDFTILTSISEGQPLTILEGFAAKKPAIATDVGNCSGLIHGEDDDFGDAGVITHIMNVEEITDAILLLAGSESLRKQMGENGYKRVKRKYQIGQMKNTYARIYEAFEKAASGKEEQTDTKG